MFLSVTTLAILTPEAREELHDWVQAYPAKGGLIAFDPNYRPRLWPDVATVRYKIGRFRELTDISLRSSDGQLALFGDPDQNAVTARLAAPRVGFAATRPGRESAQLDVRSERPSPVDDGLTALRRGAVAFVDDKMRDGRQPLATDGARQGLDAAEDDATPQSSCSTLTTKPVISGGDHGDEGFQSETETIVTKHSDNETLLTGAMGKVQLVIMGSRDDPGAF